MKEMIHQLCLIGLSFTLALAARSASAETFPIQVGNVISDGVPGAGAGRMDVNTDVDFYTFSGTNGQNIFLDEISVSASFAGWLRWELKSPTGVTVSSSYLEGNHDGRRTLPETGTYTIKVWVGAVNAAYIGTYSFRVRAIPADPTFAIQIGDTITNGVPAAGAGNIEVAGAWDYYTFTATSNQLAFFEVISAASTFQGNLSCELKSPSSNTVFSGYMTGGNHFGRKLLPETGTYRMRIYVQSNGTNHVGTYAMRIRPIAPDQVFAIQPGDTVSNNLPAVGAGNIEMAGAWDYYTFNGLAGQSLSFESISKSAAFGGWLQWEAKTPSGQTLFSAYFADIGRKTLPETGTYTIRFWVGANSTSYVGDYAFRINTLPGDVRLAIQKGDTIADGIPISGAGRIDQPGGLDTYTFTGLAGQNVNFDQLSADSTLEGWLYWQVITPSGTNLIAAFFPGGTSERKTLPENGTYTMRIFANTQNSSHVGAYSFRTWCEVTARPDQLATLPNTAITVPLNKFLCNDTMEIGDAPTVEPVVLTSANGGTLTLTNSALRYTPPAGYSGMDNFNYRLRGLFGDEDIANVKVRVAPGADQGATVVSVTRESPTSMSVCLFGAPNQTYMVEQSTNLFTWSSVTPITADPAGSMTYIYGVESVGKRFYRFRKP